MNRLSLLVILCLLAFVPELLSGQSMQEVSGVTFPQHRRTQNIRAQGVATHSRVATCGPDTVRYTESKSTGLRAISLNNATSATAAGQYFDAPQAITLSGFQFYGWSTSLPVVNVTCAVYLAGADSLPTGAPLVTTTVAVDTTFGGGTLPELSNSANFAAPVTVNAPYVIVVENPSANNVAVICGDYTVGDGLGENLSSALLGVNWTHGLDLVIGGSPFDADWLFNPYASYQLNAGFSATPTCLLNPNTLVNFTNSSSPILDNRMYSVAAFLGVPSLSYTWNFGDGSPVVNAVDTFHTYVTPGTYNANLTDTLFGWTSVCVTDTTIPLGAAPVAAFNSSSNGLAASFTDQSTGSPTSWLWDFGDGNTSTLQNPNHNYAAAGVYTVCLTADGGGGCVDSACATVTITSLPSGSCGPDTVEYPLAKATGLQALSINNATSALAGGQYFDAPQAITISGFDFYGWSITLPVTNVTCQLYTAGPDSLPTGAPLASVVFPLDSNFFGGNLNLLRRIVSFNAPVTVNAPYVVVVENNSANNIGLLSNDYTAVPADGGGENIAALNIGGTWNHALDVTVGPNTFDADWLIHPHASYILNADFVSSPLCLPAPNTQVDFTNLSSPILQNRMYNQAAFVGVPQASYTWDFGDGSQAVNAVDTNHVYPATGPYTATLTDTLFGWRTICTESATETLNPGPAAAFTVNPSGLSVGVVDQSTGSPTSWFWDFGDGTSSNLQNPLPHTYANPGTYTICLTVSNATCSDTVCQNVVALIAPVAGCGIDTVRYPFFKTTAAQGVALSSNGASALGQYYNAPQPITIYGWEFFAWSTAVPVQNVTASVYLAGTDSLPTGAPLVSAVVPVDSSFGGGNLAVLQRTVNFPNPLTVNAPYVIVIENTSANVIGVVANNNLVPDGQGENLASFNIGGTWNQGLDVTLGGAAFDADFLMHPVVSYGLLADFTPNPPCALAGQNVTFTNNSSPVLFDRMYNLAVFLGTPEQSSNWDFGDGSPTGYAVDTNHTYATNGPFSVTLADTLFGYTSGTCTADTTIILQGGPTAAFNASGTVLNWNFTDQSVSPAGINAWLWDFGDGNTSTLQNPSHQYASAGTYTVCLTVSDACGTDSSCSVITVVCPAPNAAFTSSGNLLSWNFTDQSTASTGILAWVWDFGDGNTATVQNPSHTYAAAGTYTVCLTVVDTCGTDSSCSVITVVCPPPTAAFSSNGNLLTYSFTDQSTSSNNISSWLWDFGDGNTSTQQNPTHTYSAAGTYTVCLTVSDSCGSDSSCSSISVVCPPPTAAFSSNGSLLTSSFTDQSTSSNSILSWLWDFGDGNTSTQQNPTHTYSAAGTYTVCLTVTDSCGSDSSCSSISIVCPPPVAAYASSGSNLFYNFTDQSTSGNAISSWFWDFGDGTTSTQQNPAHVFPSAGSYLVCLTVTDSCGSDSVCSTVNVVCPAPTAGFSFTDNGLTVDFSDGSTTANAIVAWAWDFGDGNSSNQQNPTHTYANPGSYVTCLTITDSCGNNTFCDTVTVDTIVGVGNGLGYVLEVYPIPASNQLNVNIELPQSSNVGLRIFNALGQFIREANYEMAAREQLTLDVSDLAEGAYLLEVQVGERKETRRFNIVRK